MMDDCQKHPCRIEDGRILVSCYVQIPEKGITDIVTFCLDTGTKYSIISETDATKMGIDYKTLKRSPKSIIGIGGRRDRIQGYLIPNVILLFQSNKSVEISEIITTNDIEVDRKTKRVIFAIPSLLGTDVLKKGEFSLHIDFKRDEAYLTW